MSPWLADLFLGSQSDERLVALARSGHERAFTTIVDRYRRALNAYARRIDPERAEDLVQQTFLSAFSALQSGNEVRHLRGWLYQILRNLAARAAAESPLETELTAEQAFTESAHEVAERRLLAVQALAEVARLPTHQHDALVGTALQGRARAEVADGMGLSEGAVRQLVHRARSTLRTAVTAVTPLPLARWFSGARSGVGLPDAALGAGTASAGGLALKVGGLVTSGVLATGVISALPRPHRAAHHHGSHAASAASGAGLIAAGGSGGLRLGGDGTALLARVFALSARGGSADESARGRTDGSHVSGGGGPRDRPGPATSSARSPGDGGGSSGMDSGENSSGGGGSGGGRSGSDGGPAPTTVATSSRDGSNGGASSGSGQDSSGSSTSLSGSSEGGGGTNTSSGDTTSSIDGGTQTTSTSGGSGSELDIPGSSDGSSSGGGSGPH